MAVTKTSFEWTASSSLTQTVPFEVIAAGDIDVYVEGVLQLQQNTTSTADATHPQVVSGEITQGTALTNYTVAANNGSITFNANLAVDDFVVIERTTDDTLLETFTSGSTVRARDLNSAFERVLFIAQEGVNIASEALAPADDEDDALDAKGERISNVADATDDDDAVNRAQLGKVITDDLVAGEGIDLTDVSGGTNSGQQVTVSAELSTATNPGVVQVNATSPITATYTNPGQLDLSIEDNSIDIGKIQTDDIIDLAEQNAGSPNPSDTKLFTSSAAAKRFDTLVQTSTPTGSDYQVGKTWLQNDDELTLSIWNGSAWTGVVSGGTFTNQPKVVYVDASAGDDSNDGHRISRPKLTIKAAIQQINNDANGDGSIVSVAPGIYAETLPIDIEKNDIGIIGQSLRTCIIHPKIPTADQASYDVNTPHSQELQTMFRVNSGSYFQNLTLTGLKASGVRGGNALYTDSTYGLPTNQGWNFAFYPDAVIKKSPYIQNCTNFSDSQINNVTFTPHTPGEGAAGDLDSDPTGGGILIDGSVPATASPLRSMVCDSYTHTALDGPGIFVTNNGYCQATSSYAFFNHVHITCVNGGQANLAASTTDFGRFGLVADGKSNTAIFTSNVDGAATNGDTSFSINAPTAAASWFGNATRPANNMLVTVNNVTYPVISAVSHTDSEGGSGWTVTINRPNSTDKSQNDGIDGDIADDASVEFFLRSMIASSGHTMEYVGSGTDYTALPENGGVPSEANQIQELNNGKVWAATTDHKGKFKLGDFFEVDQQAGTLTVGSGSFNADLSTLNVNVSGDAEVGADLDMGANEITSSSGNLLLNASGDINVQTNKIINVSDPTAAQDAATKDYVDSFVSTSDNIGASAITTAKIADDAVDETKLANTTVTAGSYTTADITVDAQGRITSAASGTVVLAAGQVGTNELADDAVDGTKIADDSIDSEHFVDGSIDTAHIANDAVTADKLADTTVTAGSYTAADITVDAQGRITAAANGTTDADTVDGLHASSFVRSDANDTLTGALTFSSSSLSRFTAGGLVFNDNRYLYFGSGAGSDYRLGTAGTILTLDMGSSVTDFLIRDGTTTRFTFDDNGSFTATGNITGNNLNGTLGNTQVRNAIAQGNAGNLGTYALLKKENSGSVGAGGTVSGSNLRYSSAAGNSQGTPSGTWRCMGRALDDGSQTGEKLTTVWLRIS